MNRRAFFGGLAGVGVVAARAFAQNPTSRDTTRGAADPLPWPGAAGADRPVVQATDNDPTVKNLERRFRCTCGCGLDVYTCRTTDFTCTYSPELHREVVALMEAGQTPDQVVDSFIAKYGESILMAPEAKGFGAIGYALPGAAILLAGSLLAVILVRRSRRMQQVAPAPAPSAGAGPVGSASTDEMARLERALRELES
jgi:cytochrome c-type biogenesis protein CcmH